MVTTKAVVLSAVAVGAIATAAASVYIIHTRQSNPDKKKRRKKKNKKSKKSEAVIIVPSDDELADMIMQSIQTLQMSTETKGENEQRVLSIIKQVVPSTLSTRTRLLAAQWCILYSTLVTLVTSHITDTTVLMQNMKKSMECAWNLLDCSPKTNPERYAIDILMLDVAQRLRDPKKLIPVYERVLLRRDLSNEEELVMFTTAPLLGRWKDTKMLGKKIESRQRSLKEFHAASLARPELPDYEVLFTLSCSDLSKAPIPTSENLQWITYEIKQFRIKQKNVECADEEKAKSIRDSISNIWQDIPVEADHRLFRHGAIGQMLSSSNVKVSMVGPWDDKKCSLHGYVEVEEGSMKVRQTEIYEFSEDIENSAVALEHGETSWSGVYNLIQEQLVSERDEPVITVTFDLQLVLAYDKALN